MNALIERLRAMYVANGTNYVQAAADKLEAQAERIKELEAEIITRTTYGDEQTDFAIKLAAERDALRAQLAEIAAAEPVAKLKPCKEGWFIDLDNPPPITGETIELFTRHMPAQGVKDAERYRWLAAYLVSDYTEHDDALVDCSSVEAMSAFIDAKGAKFDVPTFSFSTSKRGSELC